MKKIICLIMTFIIISSVCCVGTFAEENDANNKYEQYCYDTLVALGILNGDESLNERITKGQFSDIVVKMLKIDGTYDEDKLYFRDVPVEHEYYNSISILAKQGYLFGDEVQRVYPDEYISKNTALVIMVRALGYELIAQHSGGYIAGYADVWNTLDLDNGLSGVPDENFDMSKIAVLVYNTLLAKQPGSDYISNSSISLKMEAGSSILYSMYNGCEFKGIVNKNGYTSINSVDRYEDERIRIGNTEMRVAAPEISKYLGYEVIGIMLDSGKGEEDYTLISFTESRQNEDLIINSADIVSVPDTLTIKYDDGESSKTRTAELTRNVSVIYNYQYLSSYSKEDLDIDTGYLKLVDNDSDGEYDIVFLYEYKTYFVAGVDVHSNYIYDKYGYAPLEVDDETIITNSSGTRLTISFISPKNILSVYEPKNSNNNSITVIEQSMVEPITGIVSTSYEEDGTHVKINEQEYRVSDRYATISELNTSYKKIKVGLTGTFYIDNNMEICGFEASNNDFIYAYLLGIGVDEHEEISQCRVFTQYGEFKIYTFHKRLKINGERVEDIYEIDQHSLLCSEGKAIPQLIKYKTNSEGIITEMLISNGTTVSPMDCKDNAVNYNGMVENGAFRPGGRKYNYEYIYNDDTVIFIIPDNLNNERDFYISNKVFTDGQKTTMNVYDADSSYLMKAAVIDGGNVTMDFTTEAYLAVVTDTGIIAVNDDDELVDVIKAYYKGQENRYESLQEDNWFDGFSEGDIVHILIDSITNRILGTKKIFTFDDAGENVPTTDSVIYHDEYSMKSPHSTNVIPSYIYGATGMVYGNCIAKGTDYITLTIDGGTTGEPFSTDKSTLVYIVDKSGRWVDVVTTSMDAIMVASTPSAGNGSNVLINTRNAIVKEIFIIKE